MNTNKIKITESELKQIVAESVKKMLKEIGDTPKGQFALGAVKGRAAARPRYQNKKYGGLRTQSQQDNIVNNAADAAWEKRKDLDVNKYREMKNAEDRGYYYGFEKGMTNEVAENKLKQIVAESVKKIMNEISSDFAYSAYDKAEKSGRLKQAQKFSDYGFKDRQ